LIFIPSIAAEVMKSITYNKYEKERKAAL